MNDIMDSDFRFFMVSSFVSGKGSFIALCKCIFTIAAVESKELFLGEEKRYPIDLCSFSTSISNDLFAWNLVRLLLT